MQKNNAWFCLAMLLATNHHEKALALYRLICHQLGNEALAAKIEGDLLWAAGQPMALYIYLQAAQLYEKSGDRQGHHAVLQHCATVWPDSEQVSAALAAANLQANSQTPGVEGF